MLKDSFYRIIDLTYAEQQIIAVLHFEPGHAIFGGHFPGQPVVPGACLLEIVKEVLNEALKGPYQLKKAANLKFIAPIDPRMSPEAELKITYKTMDEGIQINASLTANGVVCFKMQGVFATSLAQV